MYLSTMYGKVAHDLHFKDSCMDCMAWAGPDLHAGPRQPRTVLPSAGGVMVHTKPAKFGPCIAFSSALCSLLLALEMRTHRTSFSESRKLLPLYCWQGSQLLPAVDLGAFPQAVLGRPTGWQDRAAYSGDIPRHVPACEQHLIKGDERLFKVCRTRHSNVLGENFGCTNCRWRMSIVCCLVRTFCCLEPRTNTYGTRFMSYPMTMVVEHGESEKGFGLLQA